MYDKKLKRWVTSEPVGHSSGANGETEDALYAEYAKADASLTDATTGTKNVEAVYLMERTAKKGYAPACLAMAQMFEYGWAVAKSQKLSLKWYQKAAEAGSAEAKAYLERRKKARRNHTIAGCVLVAVIAAVAALFVMGVIRMPQAVSEPGELVIRLPKGITLNEPETIEQYSEILRDLRDTYDNDEMRQGGTDTNRILLIYTGDQLKLSDFAIVAASTDGEMITLQFTDSAEAQRCYEYLSNLEGTVAVSIDKYSPAVSDTVTDTMGTITATASGFPYHSDVSGYDYLTWGAMEMELDQYAAYLAKAVPGKHLTVAVLDTGVEPNAITQDRILDGTNMIYGGLGTYDVQTHGTHVSGIILDCTQGLDIDILPVGIFYSTADNGYISPTYSTSSLTLGMEYATVYGVKVINLSLGGSHDDLNEYYINKAIDAGITVVVSAGNDSILIDSVPKCPAHITRCITVGAMRPDGTIADFSNYGDQVDVCAPGYEVLSYVPAPNYLDFKNGTSMASPHVAALAAMISLEYDAAPEYIEHYIKVYSDGRGNDKQYYGEGLPLAGYFVENPDE